jgi:hypothetical protein
VSLFADWNNDTVVVQRIGAPDGFGGRLPDGNPYPVPCSVEQTSVRLRSADGTEKLSTATLYFDIDAGVGGISPDDKVTLPDGRQTAVITVTIISEGTELDGITVTVE